MSDVKHTPAVGDILQDPEMNTGPYSFVVVEKVGPEGLTVRSCNARGRVWWPFPRIIEAAAIARSTAPAPADEGVK